MNTLKGGIRLEWFIKGYGEVLIKIVLCMILAGLIGYNREKNGTPIGIRTHIIVGLSAVIIQITALRYANEVGQTDHMRLAGQFISGIAFLGTGTIIKQEGSVRGLTTASSIFFAACIGITVGTGLYIEAIIVTLVAYALLIDIMGLKRILRTKGCRTVTISIEFEGNCRSCQETIIEELKQINVEVIALEINMTSEGQSKILLKLVAHENISDNSLLLSIIEVPSIIKAEILQG